MEIRRGDYTARTAETIRDHVKAELVRRFPDIDFDLEENSTSIENIMMTPGFFAQDSLNLYLDAEFSEAFLDTLVEKANAESKAKLEGYPISRRTAAVAELVYTYTKDIPAAPNFILIPRGTVISTPGSSLPWVFVEPVTVVLAGGTFSVCQGVFVTDSFTAVAGSPDQAFTMSRENVAGNVDFAVTVAGVPWNEVERVSRAGAADAFQVEWFGDTVRVRFGDGANGNIPAGTVSVTYLSTSGAAGSVAALALAGTYKASNVTVAYTNPLAATGSNGDSVSDLKRNVPGWSRAQDRLVTSDDYVQWLESQPGVMYASMEYVESLRKKVFYLMTSGYTVPSQAVLDQITEAARGKNQEHTLHEFRPVREVGAVVSMLVKLHSWVGKSSLATKRQEITEELQEFFYPTVRTDVYNNAVGRSVRLSDAFRIVESVKGVDYVEMRAFTRQPALMSENWSEGADDVALSSWSVAATRFGTSVESLTQLAGLDSREREASFKGSVFEIALTPTRRWWSSWPFAGAMASTLSRAFRRTSTKTGHFAVTTRFFDGSTSPTVISSYVGVETVVGYGFFTFTLDATRYATSFLSSTPEYVDGYPVFTAPQGQLCAGTVRVIASDPSTGSTITVTDNGSGGLVTASGVLSGYVDYDSGKILMLGTDFISASVTAMRFDFANQVSETAEIVVSPAVGDILVRPKEFCGIESLQVEVTV